MTRVKTDKLRSIFAGGALLSPALALKTGAVKEGAFTPPLEDELFGGFDCVFASYGPYPGRERYGEVILRLDFAAVKKNIWASFSSGWGFMGTYRRPGTAIRGDTRPSPDDIAAFASTVFTGADIKNAFPFVITAFLRKRPAAGREELLERLLAAPDGPAFYELVDSERLGYFEAKAGGSIPLESVLSIEVPEAALKEVLDWPETGKYRARLAGY